MKHGSYFFSGGGNAADVKGVPFRYEIRDGIAVPLEFKVYPVDEKIYSYALFAGMVGAKADCIEWWGPEEYWHNNSFRLYIGDYMGEIRVIYDNSSMECVPLIFGVTVWNYELCYDRKEYEQKLYCCDDGPFTEPFQSDKTARKLLDDSLLINENEDGDKASKFVLAVKLKQSLKVREICLSHYGKVNRPFISGFTLAESGFECPFPKTVTGNTFINKSHLNNCERLARRLYQFRDELPAKIAPDKPENYRGIDLTFSGESNVPQILTNIFYRNILDMSLDKIDSEGRPHTSGRTAPSFGNYIGFGVHRNNVGHFRAPCFSRDLGRTAIEVLNLGNDVNMRKFVDVIHQYLYDDRNKYYEATWLRVCNCKYLGWEMNDFLNSKENDGHASMMLAVYHAYRCGIIGLDYIKANKKFFYDAAGWYGWQVENPGISNFELVLCGETEASTQQNGIPDLFSNAMSVYALEAYAFIAEDAGFEELQKKCTELAQLLRKGIEKVFSYESYRHGEVYHDSTYDCWTYDYKRFVYAFVYNDIYSYDLASINPLLRQKLINSYREQKDRFFNHYSARQLGYGQAYITHTALMLDEVVDYTKCLEACAYVCYHHTDHNYIVPEGAVVHPSGRYWFRNGDHGNAVQQAEIIKVMRLVIGLDDLSREGKLKIIPRLADTFDGIDVKDFTLHLMKRGAVRRQRCAYAYFRTENGYRLIFSPESSVEIDYIRFGPFACDIRDLKISGAGGVVRVEEIAGRKYAFLHLDKEVAALDISVEA